MGRTEGNLTSFAFFDRFDIVDEDKNGKLLQSKWYTKEGREPMSEQKLKAEIRRFVAQSFVIGTQ